MPVTGPVIPRHYGSTGDSPTPTIGAPAPSGVSTFSGGGEIITCPRTGRMWIHRTAQAGPSGHTEAWVPVRPEFTFTNLSGETLAGVQSTLFGVAPFQSCGVEIYGGGLKVGRVESSGDVISIGTMQCAAFSMNSASTFNVTTSSAAANPIHLRALKPTMSNDSTTATGANRYWFSVTGSLGCEFGDSGGTSGAYRTNAVISGTKAQFERMIEANDGVRVTDLPSKYLLGTDVDGDLETRGLTSSTAYLTTSQTLVANTDTSLSSNGLNATIADAGTYLFTVRVAMNHAGNYSWSMWLRHDGLTAYVLTSRTEGSGWTMMEATGIYTTVSASQSFRVFVRSTHTPDTQITTADGGAAAAEVKLSSLSWVRLA